MEFAKVYNNQQVLIYERRRLNRFKKLSVRTREEVLNASSFILVREVKIYTKGKSFAKIKRELKELDNLKNDPLVNLKILFINDRSERIPRIRE